MIPEKPVVYRVREQVSMSRQPRTPSYRLHKPSGQAVVTLNGKEFCPGPHGSQPSRDHYDRLVAEWLANGRRLPISVTPRTRRWSSR